MVQEHQEFQMKLIRLMSIFPNWSKWDIHCARKLHLACKTLQKLFFTQHDLCRKLVWPKTFCAYFFFFTEFSHSNIWLVFPGQHTYYSYKITVWYWHIAGKCFSLVRGELEADKIPQAPADIVSLSRDKASLFVSFCHSVVCRPWFWALMLSCD